MKAVLDSFRRGVTPAELARGFGVDVKDVVDFLVHHLRAEGLSDDELAALFGEVWGLDENR